MRDVGQPQAKIALQPARKNQSLQVAEPNRAHPIFIILLRGNAMLSFSKQEVPPALKSHLNAQFSFLADMSKKMFEGVQKIGQLNVQVAQTVMDEAINNTHQLIESNNVTDYMALAASQVQPVADKVRAYQQHMNTIAAGMQVELSRTAEQHVPETTRTAAAVAEEVVRRGAEETDKATERQKAVFEKLTKPINEASTPQNGMQPPPQSPAKQPPSKCA
jgi:phasin family protein